MNLNLEKNEKKKTLLYSVNVPLMVMVMVPLGRQTPITSEIENELVGEF